MESTKKIIEAFFDSKDKIVYGFTVLQEFYENIHAIIDEDNVVSTNAYPLLSSLNGSMQYVFKHIDLNYLCDDFRWFSFIQNVLTISDLMDPNEKQAEIQALIQLNKFIGKSLANCNLDVKKRWYEYLRVFNYANIEQKHQAIISKCVFSFLESQILFDNHNLISSYFFDKLLKDEPTISACFIRVFLLTSCYLYYLGCREEERYVNDIDKDLRSRSKLIINQSIIKFKKLLGTIAYRDVNLNSVAPYNHIDIFNANLFSFMKDSLSACEYLIPEEPKIMIMNDVVDEFILHSLVYIKYEAPFVNMTVGKVMNDKQAESLFIKFKTNEKIIQSHKSFLRIFNSIRFEKNYNLFIKELENAYKRNLIRKKREPKEENFQIIEEKISQRIRDVLGPYENGNCTKYVTTTLLSSTSIPNDIELESLLSSFIDGILTNIVITLFNRMKKNNEATTFKRSNLFSEIILENSKTDDENLLKLIEKHKGHIYIGGEGLLQPNDICFYYERYNNAINCLSKKHYIGGLLGIFIDSAKINISVKNISISRSAKTIQDSEAIENNGTYKYAPTGIEMTYTKEELEKHLEVNESVFAVSADVGYNIEPETKVDFICMK